MQKQFAMAIKDKVEKKEIAVKKLLETLRHKLNDQSKIFNKQPNDWQYLTTLCFTENKLEELLEYFQGNK